MSHTIRVLLGLGEAGGIQTLAEWLISLEQGKEDLEEREPEEAGIACPGPNS